MTKRRMSGIRVFVGTNLESTRKKMNLRLSPFSEKKKGRLRSFHKKKDKFKRSTEDDNKEVIYYEYKKLGHMKVECPTLRKRWTSKKKAKKSLMAT